jgi:hypothetical protein
LGKLVVVIAVQLFRQTVTARLLLTAAAADQALVMAQVRRIKTVVVLAVVVQPFVFQDQEQT